MTLVTPYIVVGLSTVSCGASGGVPRPKTAMLDGRAPGHLELPGGFQRIDQAADVDVPAALGVLLAGGGQDRRHVDDRIDLVFTDSLVELGAVDDVAQTKGPESRSAGDGSVLRPAATTLSAP